MAVNPYQIIDHVSKAKEKLISAFSGRPKIEALLESVVTELQELEAVFYSLIYHRFLGTAQGEALDFIGSIVGEKRSGLDDEAYRGYIRARVQTNLSNGEPERIIFILKSITNASLVQYSQQGPASVSLGFIPESPLFPFEQQRLYNHLEDALPSGVSLTLVEADPEYFGFLEDPNALGFDEGYFSELIP